MSFEGSEEEHNQGCVPRGEMMNRGCSCQDAVTLFLSLLLLWRGEEKVGEGGRRYHSTPRVAAWDSHLLLPTTYTLLV